MVRLLPLLLLTLLLPVAADAGQRLTLYLDGAVVERDVRSSGGIAELPLSAGVERGSIRVTPPPGVTLLQVEQSEPRPSKQQQKELAAMEEQRRQLQDRLQALAVKEEIYRGAAKSQSAKAPRKTKSNPEPMAAIRQGTDYAIGQLESVLRLQRRTREEMARVDADLERRRRQANLGGVLLRVRCDRKEADLRVRYLQRDLAWRPAVAVRVHGQGGELELTAGLPPLAPGSVVSVVTANLADQSASPRPVTGTPRLTFPLAFLREESAAAPLGAYIYRFPAPLSPSLIPQEAACYRNGEYLGIGALKHLPDSAEMELACGR